MADKEFDEIVGERADNAMAAMQAPRVDFTRADRCTVEVQAAIDDAFKYHPWNGDQTSRGDAVRDTPEDKEPIGKVRNGLIELMKRGYHKKGVDCTESRCENHRLSTPNA